SRLSEGRRRRQGRDRGHWVYREPRGRRTMKPTSIADLARGAPVRPNKFGHIVLRTANMPRLRDWYVRLLNARISYQNELVSFLAYDNEHQRLGIGQFPDLAFENAGHTGLEHLSYSYQDLASLLAPYRRLKSEGIDPFWTINHGPTISLYYRDPDSNK